MLLVYLERITVLSALGDRFISSFNSTQCDGSQFLSQAFYLQSTPWFNEYVFSTLSKQHAELHAADIQDGQEVSPESLKTLSPEIGEKRERRAMTLAFGTFFPKFLENRFSFREVEGHVSIEHLQAICIHLCLHFRNSYLRWMARLTFYRWGNWRSEKLSHSRKVILPIVST